MDSHNRIGSGLGVSLFADECTTKVEMISYVRLLVELDLTKPMPKPIKVMVPIGKIFDQKVAYDWVPEYCPTCLQVGHVCRTDVRTTKVIPVAKQHQRKPRMEWRRRAGQEKDEAGTEQPHNMTKVQT